MANRQHNHEMENKISGAFSRITPNDPASILSECQQSTEKKGRILMMKETRKKAPIVRRVAGLAAALILALGLGTTLYLQQNNSAVVNTVSLDVNPSIEISLNKAEKVVEVVPLNEEGRIVMGDMKFEGSDLNLTINALIGSMLRNGYISELANSILLSVNGEDEAASTALREKLAGEIDQLLTSEHFTGAVLSQTVANDPELKQLADEYGITTGKAQLIRQITLQNTRYTFEELVPLSINQLNLISESGSTRLEYVESSGVASDKNYIGTEAARAIAVSHAAVEESAVTKYKSKLDFENGVMVYEIEFDCEEYEYDYDVHAETGEVLKSEKEKTDGKKNNTANTSNTTANYIGEETALAAALAHANVSADANTVTRYKNVLERENGAVVYDIEFVFDGYEYDYHINAETGSVVKYEKELEEKLSAPSSTATDTLPSGVTITKEEAIASALAHANLPESGVKGLKCELDRDDGVLVYEVEFKVDGMEYEYEIAATNGTVISYDKERDD